MNASRRSLGVSLAAALFVAGAAHADPTLVKLWVQIPKAGGSDAAMLLDLVNSDPRVSPIVRINIPNIGPLQSNLCIPSDPAQAWTVNPQVAACEAAQIVKAITNGRPAPTDGYHIALMLAGFGSGGSWSLNPATGYYEEDFYFPAPALAKPKKRAPTQPPLPGGTTSSIPICFRTLLASAARPASLSTCAYLAPTRK